MAQEKLPPHDIEAEEAVIGSLLIDPEAILKVATFLKPEDFFDETNQVIYQACFSLFQLRLFSMTASFKASSIHRAG
ncbi:unnamed protein product [marine sediment metagenome]|uniref:DNA helicase DnaB-like N-terminal domain-containing protein n=1 Tax=marine sediment metagenome TaxID=412755 RepID=X1MFN4_9ZZZZ